MENDNLEIIAHNLGKPMFNFCPICRKKLIEPGKFESIKTKISYIVICPICGILNFSSDLKSHIVQAMFSKSKGTLNDDNPYTEFYRFIMNNYHTVGSYLYWRKNKEEVFNINKEKFTEIANNPDLPKALIQKRDQLLLNIYNRTEYFESSVQIEKDGWYLCYAKNEKEFNSILNQCETDKLIKRTHSAGVINQNSDTLPERDPYYKVTLTQKGFSKVEEIIEKEKSKVSNNAFVVMKLDGHEGMYQNFYNFTVKPAIKKAGYNPLPIVDKATTDLLITEIMEEIRKSAFVVVIMAKHYPELNRDKILKKEEHDSNYNIYWEAGFAKGCGKEVFLLYPDSIGKVYIPFDLHSFRQYRYDSKKMKETQPDLIRLLSSNIIEIVGKGREHHREAD